MLFGAPWWLLATAAGSIPLIIHLLNRRRFKRVTWAAMEFLLAAVQKNRRRMRLENLIVLLLRIAVLVLLALAFAQPFLGKDNPLHLGSGVRVCRIFVLDDSYSMGYEAGGSTSFEVAKRLIGSVLEKSGQGDWGLLVKTSSDLGRLGDPSTNLTEVRSELEKSQVTHRVGQIPEALARTATLAAKGGYPRTEIYVLTDMQREAWFNENVLASKELAGVLKGLRENVAVFVVDVGADKNPSNTAVTELELTAGGTEIPQRLVAADVPLTVFGKVKNFGSIPVKELGVQLMLDGKVEGRKSVTMNAGQEMEVQFPVVFEQTGFHSMQLVKDPDRLSVDDTRNLAVDVRKGVSALCVNGEPSPELVDNETYFLERSLSPQQFEFARGLSVFTTRTVTDVDFLQSNLGDYELVVLANVFQVPVEKAGALKRFVEGGGGLLVFLGARVEPGAYNQVLYAEGEGLLPARLGQARVTKIEDSKVRFDMRGADHPVLRLLSGQGVDLGMFRVWGYYSLTVDETRKDVRVLCRYDDAEGTPAMVEKRYGSGRVVLVNTTADAAWSSFAPGPYFPLFVQEMSRYLAGGSLEGENLRVGEPLRQVLFPGQFGERVVVTNPEGDLSEMMPEPEGEGFLFRYNDTWRAGMYTVEFGGTRGRAVYAVNLDARESDLTRTEQKDLEEALPEARLNYVEDATSLAKTVEQESTSRPFWRPILYTVLGIMLLESVLAHYFGNRSGVRAKTE